MPSASKTIAGPAVGDGDAADEGLGDTLAGGVPAAVVDAGGVAVGGAPLSFLQPAAIATVITASAATANDRTTVGLIVNIPHPR
jgi:hypothetical protein